MFHVFCTSEETFQLYEGNNHLNFLFHDQRSSENMARQLYLHGRPLVRCNFSHPFPPKKHLDHESQKSRFRFDLRNPLEVWILWIHDPFLDFSIKMQNPFLDSRIRKRISPKKHTLRVNELIMAKIFNGRCALFNT